MDIAKLVQSIENKSRTKNLNEVDIRPNTFKKLDAEGIINNGKYNNINTYL